MNSEGAERNKSRRWIGALVGVLLLFIMSPMVFLRPATPPLPPFLMPFESKISRCELTHTGGEVTVEVTASYWVHAPSRDILFALAAEVGDAGVYVCSESLAQATGSHAQYIVSSGIYSMNSTNKTYRDAEGWCTVSVSRKFPVSRFNQFMHRFNKEWLNHFYGPYPPVGRMPWVRDKTVNFLKIRTFERPRFGYNPNLAFGG